MKDLDSVRLNFSDDSLWILNLCLALIMFGVALELKISDFKRLLATPRTSITGLIAQFILLPLVTFLLVLITQPHAGVALGMILVASCPGGNISNFLSYMAKGNVALSVSLTAVGTVLAIFMTPFNLEIWASLYAPTSKLLKEVELDAWSLFKSILTLAGIPLILGMLLTHYRSDLSAKIARGVKPFSIIIFAAFVVVALANNFDHFLNYIDEVILIVAVHNALALATGYISARIMNLSIADQRTIAIETGIQNSGLGLFLIFRFFDGLGGMALVAAWWGIWHIVSGLFIAFYWGRSDSKILP